MRLKIYRSSTKTVSKIRLLVLAFLYCRTISFLPLVSILIIARSIGLVAVSIGLNSKYVNNRKANRKTDPKAFINKDFGLIMNSAKKISPKNDKYDITLLVITMVAVLKVQP